jgi:hypothetical protein
MQAETMSGRNGKRYSIQSRIRLNARILTWTGISEFKAYKDDKRYIIIISRNSEAKIHQLEKQTTTNYLESDKYANDL